MADQGRGIRGVAVGLGREGLSQVWNVAGVGERGCRCAGIVQIEHPVDGSQESRVITRMERSSEGGNGCQ
jgi:hypothetical protein